MAIFTKGIKFVSYLLIAAFILPEVSLRVVGFHGESDKREFIQYDERLGWSFIPNKNVTDTGFEWKVKYHINEDGIRERSNIPDKKKDVYRILILGDSLTEGLGIRQNKRFSYLTETFFNKENKRVEIINAGVRGYNLTQYYIFFQLFYERYKPDLVIIAAMNDDLDVVSDKTRLVANTVYQYYRPYYNLEGGDLVLKGIPVPMPDTAIYGNDKTEPFKKYPREYLALYNFLRILSDRNVFLNRLGMLLHFKKDASKYPKNNMPQYVDNRQLNEKISAAIIEKMFNRLKQDGSDLLVFLLLDDSSGNNLSYFRELSDDIGFFYASFPELCYEYKKDRRRYHFRFDPHFNEKGNALVAQMLYEFLDKEVLGKQR